MTSQLRSLCSGGLVCSLAAWSLWACSAESGAPPPVAGQTATGGATGSGATSGTATGTGAATGTGTGAAASATTATGTGAAASTTTGTGAGPSAPTGTGAAAATVIATGGATSTPATTGTGAGASTTTPATTGGDGTSGIIPDDGGNFIKDWDASGVIGSWYTYQDTGGSTITATYQDPNGYGPFGSQNGEFCFSGTAVGHNDVDYSTNWGVGVGFDVCAMPADMSWLPPELASQTPEAKFQAADCPTLLTAVNSITFTVTGNVGSEFRVGFKATDAQEVAPFVAVVAAGTYTFTPAEMVVPASWDVANPGETGSSNIVGIQFQVASQSADTPFDFCISAVTIT